MSRRRLVLVGAAAALAAFPLLPTSAASGQTAGGVTAVGWWTRNPAASAPAGGLAVGVVPDGPATVSAVKVDLRDGVTTATLELAESGGAATDVASVLACETSSTWQPIEKGPIEASPATTCAEGRSVVLTRDAGSLTWSADLSALLAGRKGMTSIALVPVQASDGVGRVAYEVQWSGPPTFTSTPAASAASAAPSSPVTTTTAAPQAPAASPRPAPAAAAPRSPSFAVSPAAVPTAVLPSSGVAQGATTTVPEATTTTVPAAVTSGLAETAPLGGGADPKRPFAQAVFFIVISAIAGSIAGIGRWWATSRRPASAR